MKTAALAELFVKTRLRRVLTALTLTLVLGLGTVWRLNQHHRYEAMPSHDRTLAHRMLHAADPYCSCPFSRTTFTVVTEDTITWSCRYPTPFGHWGEHDGRAWCPPGAAWVVETSQLGIYGGDPHESKIVGPACK